MNSPAFFFENRRPRGVSAFYARSPVYDWSSDEEEPVPRPSRRAREAPEVAPEEMWLEVSGQSSPWRAIGGHYGLPGSRERSSE